jgi:hypothetical protein
MTSAKRPGSPTPPSTPRLSEAARHFVIPKGIVSTGFPSVRATCLQLKITFDPWQEGAAAALLGKRKDGLYAADAIVMSIPRQVGKTFLIGAVIFALCIKTPGLLCVWTAHHYPTASETFDSMKAMAQRPELKPHVKRAVSPGGNGIIEFRNGSRILFGARERGFGRGIPKIGIVVFDEAQILGQSALDDMIPATNRADNPLIFYIGTPPKPSDPSEVFVNLRQEAIEGESEDTLYVEFSADEDADPNDREQWAKANPSYPRHTPARAILRMKKHLGLASFLREGLGIWDAGISAGVFSTGAWARCSTDTEPGELAAFGIAADLDQSWLSLAAVSAADVPHVAATLRARFDTERARFVSEVKRLADGHPVAIDKKGPAAPLIEDLRAEGVQIVELSGTAGSDAGIRDAVETRRLHHANYPELNAAVDAATWKTVGEGHRVITRKSGDVSMLEAAGLALLAIGPNYDVLTSAY